MARPLPRVKMSDDHPNSIGSRHQSGRTLLVGKPSCFHRIASNISAPVTPSRSRAGAPCGTGCSAMAVLRQRRGHRGEGMASRAGSSSKGSEALRLVFSRIDAGCGNRRGSGGRPNGPCKAMCFLPCSIIPGGLRPVTAPSRSACRSSPDGCACRATRKGESDACTDPTA